jgi:UDP-N-acetylglucosamine 2-epimerase (non-hydrolysing)
MRNRILIVLGTRPEAIKLAPVAMELAREQSFEVRVCSTGQHIQMLQPILQFFQLEPDYDLGVMRTAGSLEEVTAQVLTLLTPVLRDFRPDLLLVQGDTATTMAGALAAFYLKIAVGHVEAGLRTYNLEAPWPEEMNRQLTTRLATYHFPPTPWARRNLLREGVDPRCLEVTGNTGVDSLLWIRERLAQGGELRARLTERIREQGYPLGNRTNRILLVTGHRRENFGRGFEEICLSLREITRRFPDVDVVYPVHLNPNVRAPVFAALQGAQNVYLLEPLDYPEFVLLMQSSHLLLTDSGGIQEEAPSLGKPVLVMRDHTERPEGVRAGTVRLVGSESRRIVPAVAELLAKPRLHRRMSRAHNPYGDGLASRRIRDFLRRVSGA